SRKRCGGSASCSGNRDSAIAAAIAARQKRKRRSQSGCAAFLWALRGRGQSRAAIRQSGLAGRLRRLQLDAVLRLGRMFGLRLG
ncbi:hypothetical protein O6161_25280, partial [Salmonella enterica subsp. enterica]